MTCIINRNAWFRIKYLKYLKSRSVKSQYLSTISNAALNKKEVSSNSLKPKYSPADAESQWYDWWESQNYFKPKKSERESFVIMLPPPNVTGTLHLGHILTITLQDVILRWKRMNGESVLWVPGVDHAGIATQVVVEKHLKQHLGLLRHDIGREKFLEEVWKWKNEKGNEIIKQIRKIGASLDWTKLKYTMDPAHSQLVNEAFIKLYNQGLIYRSERLINWSCALKSSISDVEVEWVEINNKAKLTVPGYNKPIFFGILYKFAYKVVNEDDEIIVSTTRPETMLGDVAIAVHPNDSRYSKYKDKKLWHPFRNEEIPVILDDFVDPNFGTGAVKITPSHSLVDFEVGVRHNLKSIPVISEDGHIRKIGCGDKFHGMKRFDARDAIIKNLRDLELFRGISDHKMQLPRCSRSGDVVEFMLKDQWYLKCQDVAKKAIEVVETEKLKFHPKYYNAVWYEWLKNIKDWNLSRQIWWGHQIPMYECSYGDEKLWLPALSLEEAKQAAAKKFNAEEGVTVVRDPDVLDTWFSSGLLPLSLSSESTENPPISLMVTGHDILFFWVARMVMLSVQLTGKLPFNNVFLHGLVCDSHGKKMSKSLGNVIKPENIIYGCTFKELVSDLENNFQQGLLAPKDYKEALQSQKSSFPNGIPECGVDGLRMTLCSYKVENQFLNFDMELCTANRHFCNKIWQAMNYYIKIVNMCDWESTPKLVQFKPESLNIFDKWILSKLASTAKIVNECIEIYKFSEATTAIRTFVVNDLCSVYLESTKATLQNASPKEYKTTVSVFHNCMECSLKFLSPFMPFLSEHLYHALPVLEGSDKFESVTVAKYPKEDDWIEYRNTEIEEIFESLLEVINGIRKIKAMFSLKEKPEVFIECSNEVDFHLFGEAKNVFKSLSGVKDIQKVSNTNSANLIEENIKGGKIFVKHPYDSKTILSMFEKILNEENKYENTLSNLIKKEKEASWEEKSQKEKLRHSKQIIQVETQLEKIKQVKKVLENCNR